MQEQSVHQNLRVAVVGGGITGLAAAHRLLELDTSTGVTLLEAEGRLGGVLRTETAGPYLIEHGADMFTTRDPWALDLCQRIGLADELIGTNEQRRRAFVVHQGRLYPVPEGFTLMSHARIWPILTTPLLSWRAKLRLAREFGVQRRLSDEDESLASFARRRLGDEVYRRLIQPLIGGIYTADPDKLSMQAALPQFVAMEQEFGSVTRGARRQARSGTADQRESGARYSMFLAPRMGMQQLTDAIASRLVGAKVRTDARVETLSRLEDDRWAVRIAGVDEPETYDRVIVATPARVTRRLIEELDPALSQLVDIPTASAAIVVLAYPRARIQQELNGFGFVVPFDEERQILSASFASNKFPGRAPDEHVLIRVFIGGACQGELVDQSDEVLLDLAARELRELICATGNPDLTRVIRWRHAMPQYHLGHKQRIAAIDLRLERYPHLALAGNSYRGVGIPFCIHSGEEAAANVLSES
jgi:oxygen-dependent protoporphyrinogen oxidase